MIKIHEHNRFISIPSFKDVKIGNLFSKLKDQNEEIYKLKNIIKSQQEKNLAEYHFPEMVDN